MKYTRREVNFMLKRFSNGPREEAIEKIESYIENNNLKTNDRLPSERDMCKMWDFNRTTLRSAIAYLKLRGVLYVKKGSGTYVSYKKIVRNLQDLESLSEISYKANKLLTNKVLALEVLESNKQISKKLKILIGHSVLELTRIRSIDGEPVSLEINYLDYERYPGISDFDFTHKSLYEILDEKYNIEIVKGNQKLAITYATEEEAKLLHIKESEPLYFISGISTDRLGVPIEYFKSLTRIDKVKFSSKLIR